ncbi:Hypothetical predicted protein [Olea europaea subsp. europaea]|uniref:Uncharacterized protein n=1 Tax=Olea europaea subsp. europaea TaxID=158383 RepID=A0A8S0Q3T7_OLEEU|nr:Hypothetical predicted protein [Olea europaea subsp. europaea]
MVHDFSIAVQVPLFGVFIISMQMYVVVGFVVNLHSFFAVTDMGIRGGAEICDGSVGILGQFAPQFHAERLGTPEESTSDDDTSDESHGRSGTSGEEEESGVDDSGEVEGEDLEDHDSGDSEGDRVRRSGQIGTFSTPYVHRATSPM